MDFIIALLFVFVTLRENEKMSRFFGRTIFKYSFSFVLVIVLSICFVSCGTKTSIVSISDESYKGSGFMTVAVSAPYEDLQIRSGIESLFKRALTNAQTRVFRAMDILPPLRAYSDSQFAEVMEMHEIQCVLVVGITDYWQTYYSTPGKLTTKTKQSSSSSFQSLSQWDGLFGVRTTGTATSSSASTSTTHYTPGITLSQSNVSLDVRMFVFGPEGEAIPIWRANSTTSGDYFTAESKVFFDAANRVNTALRNDGILKSRLRIKKLGTANEEDTGFRNVMTNSLIILGGPHYSYILGCLNCKEFDLETVFNRNGFYGVASEHTLWDPCGTYADDTSRYSACNLDAEFPPAVVDMHGKVIGHLSINESIQSNHRDSKLKNWLRKKICVECK